MSGSVEERIYAIVAEQLTRAASEIGPDMTFEAIGADSLDRVEIVMKIEEVFDVELDDDELEKLATVGDFARYIEAQLKAK
ncbi:MAG: Acyl carrier protein [candidate division TM6 bacterium GW2011_GWF2_43_17]|nr:MAG: Acyl carrier protein [candidate division TM6 bacterium GW2011_GWF2_43_17]